jgi:hypothetical protein
MKFNIKTLIIILSTFSFDKFYYVLITYLIEKKYTKVTGDQKEITLLNMILQKLMKLIFFLL